MGDKNIYFFYIKGTLVEKNPSWVVFVVFNTCVQLVKMVNNNRAVKCFS